MRPQHRETPFIKSISRCRIGFLLDFSVGARGGLRLGNIFYQVVEIDFQVGIARIERLFVAVARIVAVQTEQVFVVVGNAVAVGVFFRTFDFFLRRRQRRPAAYVGLRVLNGEEELKVY